MTSKLIALAQPFDIFGLVPFMTFAKAPKVYSRLSMTLSLMTLAFLLFITLYLGLALFNRKNPSILQYSLPYTSVYKLMFNAETFPIMVEKKIGTLVEGRDFIMDAWISIKDSNDYFEFDENICDYPYSLYMCFTQSQDVGKSYVDTTGTNFRVDFSLCATPGSGCATQSEIDTQLSLSVIAFQYYNHAIDPYDFDEPIKTISKLNSVYLQKLMNKKMVMTFVEIEITTDSGWLFESLTTQTALAVENIDTLTLDLTDSFFAKLVIRPSGNRIVYRRTYPKIQDLLAQISGIVAVIIPLVALLAFPYAEMKMKEHMVNEIYEVKLPKKSDGSSGPGKGKIQGENKNKTTKGNEKVHKKSPAANSVLPEEFGTGNREQDSPQKHLISPANEAKGKINEDPSTPLFESFENQKAGDETIIEKSTGLSRPSGLIVVSPGEPRKASFESSQTKINTLKKPRKRQIGLACFEEGTPQRNEDGLNEEVADDPDKVEGEEEEDNCEEAIEVRGAPVFLNEARHSDKLNLTFRQFLKSYFRPQPEIEIIKKVESDLTDAMDLATLAKRSSDLEKLKAILLTSEERAIFDNLPISVVAVGIEQQANTKAKIIVNHYKWENSFKGNVEKVNEAYMKLRDVDKKSEVQKRLLGFYESQYLEDYLAHAYQDLNNE